MKKTHELSVVPPNILTSALVIGRVDIGLEPEVLAHKDAHDDVPPPHGVEVECRGIVPERMPHPRKRTCDYMQHAHAKPHERDMVVLNIAMVLHIPPRREKTPPPAPASLSSDLVRIITQHPRTRQPLLRGREAVKEPRGIEEVGLDRGVRGAEEVEEDEVLD